MLCSYIDKLCRLYFKEQLSCHLLSLVSNYMDIQGTLQLELRIIRIGLHVGGCQ